MRVLLIASLVVASTATAVTTFANATASAQAATPTCHGLRATIVGTPGRDRLVGTPRKDVIVGFSGPDAIKGLGGNDIICAGGGRDRVGAGNGRNYLVGGNGNDLVVGGDGTDQFGTSRGDGSDSYFGGSGSDSFRIKNTGTDVWHAESGRDVITVLEPSRATVLGGGNMDVFAIQAGASAALLRAGGGNNVLKVIAQPPSPNQSITIDLHAGGGYTTSYDDLKTNVAEFDRTYVGVTSGAFPFTFNFEGSSGNDLVAFLGGEELDQSPGRLVAHTYGGDDRLYGGVLGDLLDGGDGTDTADGAGGTDTCIQIEQAANCETSQP